MLIERSIHGHMDVCCVGPSVFLNISTLFIITCWERSLYLIYVTGPTKVGQGSTPHSTSQDDGCSQKPFVAMTKGMGALLGVPQIVGCSSLEVTHVAFVHNSLIRATGTCSTAGHRGEILSCAQLGERWKHLVSSTSDYPNANKQLHHHFKEPGTLV